MLAEMELSGYGKFFFNVVKEGDQVVFSTDDDADRAMWVQAIYRATGQSHKPTPPSNQPAKLSNSQMSRALGGQICMLRLDLDYLRVNFYFSTIRLDLD